MSYCINIVGSKGVGKSSFINKHVWGEFKNDALPNPSIKYLTSEGEFTLHFIETVEPLLNCDGQIIMFDVLNPASFSHALKCSKQLKGSKIVCGNKTDVPNRLVRPNMIRPHLKSIGLYLDISSKSGYNYDKPILFILRQLTKNKDLRFIESIISPPEVNLPVEE